MYNTIQKTPDVSYKYKTDRTKNVNIQVIQINVHEYNSYV